MEYFLGSLIIILLFIAVLLYKKLSWFKNSYDNIRGELNNKISEFSVLSEKCRQESQKFQEVSARNINLTGKYQELLRISQTQNSNIDGLNSKINDLLAKQAAEIKNARIDANTTQRAVLRGKIGEEIAPLLPNFKYSMSNLKFSGMPVDYIYYDDLENDDIKSITFLEIKSGSAVLNSRQRQIKKAIENGNVKFEVYRIEDINNIPNNESN